MRGTVRVVALIGALLWAAPADGATPAAGKRYDGVAARGRSIVVRVAKDGTRLASYELPVTAGHCSDGSLFGTGLSSVGERPVAIDANGAFSYRTATEPDTRADRRGRPVRGRFRARFSGQFVGDGSTVQGTIEITFRAHGLHCDSGDVAFTAYLDGSPNAPFQDANIISGTYSGSTSQGFPFAARVFLPAHQILSMKFRVRARCTHRGRYATTLVYSQLVIRGDRAFSASSPFRSVVNGFHNSGHTRLTGSLQNQGHYGLSASLTLAMVARRHGTRAFSCSAQVRIADASFQG